MSESEIIENLQLPFASFRLFALEQAIKKGKTRELLALLEQMSVSEDDSECLVLIPYALTAVKSRLSEKTSVETKLNECSDIFLQFVEASDQQQISILVDQAFANALSLAPKAVDWLKAARNDAVVALVLSTFARFWPDTWLASLKPLLFSERLSIRMNALQILVQKSPDLITGNLPELLTSSDPRFRAMAIRGLSLVDMDEALAHFNYLLNSTDNEKKLAALQISIHLPFSKICPCLVNFTAREQDVSLIAKAGILFASNPDPDIPFKLWEIAMQSASNKQVAVKNIIHAVCDEMKRARMLTGEEDDYMNRLQRWIYRYSAGVRLREYIDFLPGASASQVLEMETRLKSLLKNDDVREMFVEAQNWPVSEIAKEFIRKVLQTKHEPAVAGKSSRKFSELSIDEKIRYVALLDESENADKEEVLQTIMQTLMTEPDLSATAFRSALKIGVGSYVNFARTALNSGNPNLQSAAMEYMEEFACDELFLKLGQYLKSLDLRVKRTALRVLKRHDQTQALSSLKAMLLQNDARQHHSAIACMVHFPFSSIRPLLLEFLPVCQEAALLQAGLCLFQANSDPESLYPLFKLQRQIKEGKAIVGEVIGYIIESLKAEGRLPASFSPDAARQEWQNQYHQEQEKLRMPAPYSLQHTFPEALSAFQQTSADFIREIYGRYKTMFNLYFLLAAALCILAGIKLFRPISTEETVVRSGAVSQSSMLLEGLVTSVDARGQKIFIEDAGGKQHMVLAANGTWSRNLKNTKLKLRVTPYRVNQAGMVISQLQAFEK